MSALDGYLKDENVSVRGVLSQSVFPRDAELCLLWVCPLDTRILVAVNLFLQPRDEQWFRMSHFYNKTKYNVHHSLTYSLLILYSFAIIRTITWM